MQLDDKGQPIISEKGIGPDGKPVSSDCRLFVQFLAFGDCRDHAPLAKALEQGGVSGALYLDINDPVGIGLAAVSTDADFFVSTLRDVLQGPAFSALMPKPDMTMLGRTYAIGYETDLDHVLVERPRQRIANRDWPWVVWYPLRRKGTFAKLPPKEQKEVLMEHGVIGNAFGQADFAHDIRLACHGMGKEDNDFVVGLVGKELYPLSAVVQTMRSTRQTSEFLEKLGPFFIGKAVWQSG